MSGSAQVRSIDAVDHLAAALKTFAQEAAVALADLGMDLNRALQWIEYEQKEYWTRECRRAEQQVTEARINLERRRMFHIGDHRPACDEEKKALEAAKRRLELARQKLQAVARWSRLLERESTECRAGVAPLAQWIEVDAPRAVALLQRLAGELESYVGLEMLAQAPLAGPSEPVGKGAASPGDGEGSAEKELPSPLNGEGSAANKSPSGLAGEGSAARKSPSPLAGEGRGEGESR